MRSARAMPSFLRTILRSLRIIRSSFCSWRTFVILRSLWSQGQENNPGLQWCEKRRSQPHLVQSCGGTGRWQRHRRPWLQGGFHQLKRLLLEREDKSFLFRVERVVDNCPFTSLHFYIFCILPYIPYSLIFLPFLLSIEGRVVWSKEEAFIEHSSVEASLHGLDHSSWHETMPWMSTVHGNKSNGYVWGNKSTLGYL